ncbi:hypothetical protein HRbin27_00424 [bacterium HR27]|nr:hypothetical protein HRbin27_00424 [bacterium HR27]
MRLQQIEIPGERTDRSDVLVGGAEGADWYRTPAGRGRIESIGDAPIERDRHTLIPGCTDQRPDLHAVDPVARPEQANQARSTGIQSVERIGEDVELPVPEEEAGGHTCRSGGYRTEDLDCVRRQALHMEQPIENPLDRRPLLHDELWIEAERRRTLQTLRCSLEISPGDYRIGGLLSELPLGNCRLVQLRVRLLTLGGPLALDGDDQGRRQCSDESQGNETGQTTGWQAGQLATNRCEVRQANAIFVPFQSG